MLTDFVCVPSCEPIKHDNFSGLLKWAIKLKTLTFTHFGSGTESLDNTTNSSRGIDVFLMIHFLLNLAGISNSKGKSGFKSNLTKNTSRAIKLSYR